jgi:hypothetical protein
MGGHLLRSARPSQKIKIDLERWSKRDAVDLVAYDDVCSASCF